mgnify:FL=1
MEVARSGIDKALSLRPKNRWALYYQSLVLVIEGRFDEAETAFDDAIAAGLNKDKLSDFLSVLIGRKEMARAIMMRARYALFE